jgi:hypothetical protein
MKKLYSFLTVSVMFVLAGVVATLPSQVAVSESKDVLMAPNTRPTSHREILEDKDGTEVVETKLMSPNTRPTSHRSPTGEITETTEEDTDTENNG